MFLTFYMISIIYMYIIIIILLCWFCCELDKITSNMGTIVSNSLETVSPSNLKKLEKNVLCHGTTVIPILSRKKLVILSANGEKLTWKSLELRGKTVFPAIDRL